MNNKCTESVGYSAEIIPLICDVYLSARKKGILSPTQSVRADVSEVLVRSLSKVGIVALIDEATGYQNSRPRSALQEYLNKMLESELAAWTKRFPDEFYENIYLLKKWPWHGKSKSHYSCVGMYTNDLIYDRIGVELLKELKDRTPKNENGNRLIKYHQWLSLDVGHPLLAQHMHSIILLQRLALKEGLGWKRFIHLVDQLMPKKQLIEDDCG
jgi:hypothetical protein